jgi:hypothetical protein
MKQFKQISVVLVLVLGLIKTYEKYYFKNNQLNITQQNTKSSTSKDKSTSKNTDKKKKKSIGKTRTYNPPKKDK